MTTPESLRSFPLPLISNGFAIREGANDALGAGRRASASRACAASLKRCGDGTWPTKRYFCPPASLKETSPQHSHATRRFALGSIASAVVLGAGLLGGTSALAQAYPTKPVTIIVPFAAGGTTDILARIIGQALTAELGQSVVVDNRAGAGGNIGGQAAAIGHADGHTLFMGTVGTHAINASLYKKMPFDP